MSKSNPKKQAHLRVRVSEAMKDRLETTAQSLRRRPSELVRFALEDYLNEHAPNPDRRQHAQPA